MTAKRFFLPNNKKNRIIIVTFSFFLYFCNQVGTNQTDTKMIARASFKSYDSPDQYAEAFQQMIDARQRWREQVREQEAKTVQ